MVDAIESCLLWFSSMRAMKDACGAVKVNNNIRNKQTY